MARPTEKYKRSFAGSVGAGIGSLMNGSGRTYYILEHKVTTKYHRVGESQKIIVDQVELGRDPSCQIRFDEHFGTVSRKHAAIVREGENWKLVQLSTTNSTFLNGRPIAKESYLQNGDEIQLSVNGPKMGFIIPQGKQGLTSSIKLTERLNLFRQQALRPYKRAIAALSIVLVLAVGGFGTWNYMLKNELIKQSALLVDAINMAGDNAVLADSLAKELIATNIKMADYEKELSKARKNAAAAWKAAQDAIEKVKNIETVAPEKINECYPSVYYIYISVYAGGQRLTVAGTGFLLNDGRFVTARHVVDFWNKMDYVMEGNYYVLRNGKKIIDNNGRNTLLNRIAYNFEPLRMSFIAISPSGERIESEYTSEKHPFTFGNSPTQKGEYIDEDGKTRRFVEASFGDHTDWAYFRPGKTGGLSYDSNLSRNLSAKQRLDILGFPLHRGAENIDKITPIYSESTVARDGLDPEGTILLSNNDTQGGNSGGPVMVYKDKQHIVVGILSGSTSGKGRVVPISAIN